METGGATTVVNLEVAVDAFAQSVGYVFGVETGTQFRRIGDVWSINHRNYVTHVHPRQFEFRQEFVVIDGEPSDVVETVRANLIQDADDHVLYVFSKVVAEKIPAYQTLGYEHAWNNALMGVLVEDAAEADIPGMTVHEVRTTDDLVAYQDLTGSAAVAHSLADRHIHSFLCADADGTPVGRSQLVTRVSLFGYVSGMFTKPMFRRRGVGTALMNAMHRRCCEVGARFCLLVPSRYAMEISFYPRFRYETIAPHAVFIPAR